MLKRALNARVADVLPEPTPLDPAPNLSRAPRRPVLLKREDLTPIFSFKLRGAYNRIALPRRAERARGRHRGVGGQPRAGRRLRGGPPRPRCAHRDAAHDAVDQGGGRAPARRPSSSSATTTPPRRALPQVAAETGMTVDPALRRSRRDRRPGRRSGSSSSTRRRATSAPSSCRSAAAGSRPASRRW